MADPYNDGLDDFDRDLLGHTPLHAQHLSHVSHRREALGYFPTPASSHISRPHDRHDPYYEATLLPSPSFEPEPLRRTLMPEGIPRFSQTNANSRFEPAQQFNRETPRAWQVGGPLLHLAPPDQLSQTGGFDTNNSHRRGSSSPTVRISSRKQRDALASLERPPQTLGPSPQAQIQPAPTSQADPGTATPIVHDIPLISLRQALPDKFRAIFPYELFNAVQSKSFHTIYRTNDNVVIAAPTGSGKTAILELAICKLALDRGNENFKIVYQAPTKALCSEKARDWEKKFSHMNLKCAELTGDTSQAEMRRVGDASIIVTTPEKWDSITRKWQDHRRLLQMVELFLIDEVHILKDVRGATLEAVVSRMKTIGANVRFIALSATVPNSDDIARWLGRNHTNQQLPAHRETFGEEFRPVKLQKFVYGFDSNGNDFIFDRFLDQKLPGVLSKHARQKPILIFCFTRKSCESTAAMLADFASGRPEGEDMWPVPRQRVPVVSRELQEIVKFGVAFHHAGLDSQDRAAIEQNFLKGQLGVICCTSTLAVGINLPCHTVVLKGTVGFTDDQLKEYSDLEVMQMLGRAGRPQFDDSATAIILTRSANKTRYQKMVSGQEILESTLHLNLIEHLNSEICLGTIHDLLSAKTWLGGTFLSVRLRRNPNYYQLTGGTTNPTQVDARLEEICERDIKHLQEAKLVTDQDAFRCTEYGRAMSKYMVEFQTMKLLLQIPRGAGMEALITTLSQASEFKEFRFRPAERQLFREINQSPLIMYPVKETVTQTWHKVSIVIQAHLGCVQYPDSGGAAKMKRQLMIERKLVFERLNRLVRAVIDCKGYDRDSAGTKTALELARALAAQSWEGRPTQLTQVPSIGPVGMRKLASKDIRTVLELADKDYDELERLMSRQPPFGRSLQTHLDSFPRLDVTAVVVGHRVQPRSEDPVLIEVKATLRYLNRKGPPNWSNRVPALTFLAETENGILVYFWRGSIRKLDKQAGFELKFSVGLRHVNDRVFCHFSCEEIVGTIVSTTLEHKLPASIFPLRQVSDGNFSQRERKDGQEYIDNDSIDDSDLILATEQAVVQSSTRQEAEPAPEPTHEDYPSVEELVEMSCSHAAYNSDHYQADHGDAEEMDSTQMTIREPVQLPNGRWQCNHPCSGGTLTRSGKPCSHRCCKDGLDKPRRRPLQRPKRKVEELTGDQVNTMPSQYWSTQGHPQKQLQGASQPSASIPAKRPKVHTTPSSTRSTLAPEPKPSFKPSKNWDTGDLEELALECIDLSFTDDENDDIFQSLGTGAATKYGIGVHTSGTEGKRPLGQAKAATPPTHVDNRPATTRQNDYQDDDLDDQDFSFIDHNHPSHNNTMVLRTASAFKSGASDEVLYQGMRGQFADAASSSSSHDDSSCITAITRGTAESRTSCTSVTVDDIPGMTSNPPPSSSTATEPIVSPTKNTREKANSLSEDNERKPINGNNEPDWVADFDPEFVDMFRGYVTFV
ncbi:uncharacterized protein B0H64DRAFT_44294 [Chaetomium fimeti]|uniref:DNA 3'-5' helicase n=1 Tax=Chaetomium fimeti TaxID=1854472 RepID=A0AAE0H7M0_9PEZI|nr:hypothetical protein B0H64DRAFT_44294 [Chaetomium fimeti]